VKKLFVSILVLALLAVGGLMFWASQPILASDRAPVSFTVAPGSGVRAAAQQIARAGAPVHPALLEILSRAMGKSAKIKAGSYELKPGTTPFSLVDQLVRGEFAQESLVVIEGWTFRQMRQAIASHDGLKHDTAAWSDSELLARVAPDFRHPEGLFFPDTYRFAKGASDLQIYRQAHSLMMSRLNRIWAGRDLSLPYKTPYEALTMASIIEKETGHESERDMIAAVFINRLKLGMLLQTDPTVIYGMGERYEGNIRKRDLQTDTAYNTYTRGGLPPTPIALPGAAALHAAFHPAKSRALYFVSRGNGTSQFSDNLNDHNQAVNKYQR
jgi:UPF0755 protein